MNTNMQLSVPLSMTFPNRQTFKGISERTVESLWYFLYSTVLGSKLGSLADLRISAVLGTDCILIVGADLRLSAYVISGCTNMVSHTITVYTHTYSWNTIVEDNMPYKMLTHQYKLITLNEGGGSASTAVKDF